jgi:RNA polymerase sigma-70 factor (ECF subfamily)
VGQPHDPGAIRELAVRSDRYVEWARFSLGLLRKAPPGLELRRVRVNGRPGVMALDGQIVNVLTIDVVDTRVAAYYVIRNPDKLARVAAGCGRGFRLARDRSMSIVR